MPTSSSLVVESVGAPAACESGAAENPFSEYDEGVYYPAEDGQPMANSDLHALYIMQTRANLEVLFPDDFVGSDIFWYPVKGRPEICHAPDVLVALGRPAEVGGHRRKSYLQWREEGVAPQVVFEFWSEGNTSGEEERKLRFYERYGVEEYYAYDVQTGRLCGWRREGEALVEIAGMDGWRSPRLGIVFRLEEGMLRLSYPDGTPFQTLGEARAATERERIAREQERAAKEAALAEKERERMAKEAALAEKERERAAKEAALVEKERERLAKEAALAEVERLKEKLRASGMAFE